MAEVRNQPTGASVTAFLKAVDHPRRRAEAQILKKIMGRVTGMRPKMWGPSMVGYGQYHYRYASGREGVWFLTGFAPRKAAMTIYIMPGLKKYGALLKRLGPHKHSSSCLYLSNLEKVDLEILEQLIATSVKDMRKMYPD